MTEFLRYQIPLPLVEPAMPDVTEFVPNWASPPGETILDILEDRNITLAELAGELELSACDADKLIQGSMLMTIGIAQSLSRILGGCTMFWMRREIQYREDLERLQKVGAHA